MAATLPQADAGRHRAVGPGGRVARTGPRVPGGGLRRPSVDPGGRVARTGPRVPGGGPSGTRASAQVAESLGNLDAERLGARALALPSTRAPPGPRIIDYERRARGQPRGKDQASASLAVHPSRSCGARAKPMLRRGRRRPCRRHRGAAPTAKARRRSVASMPRRLVASSLRHLVASSLRRFVASSLRRFVAIAESPARVKARTRSPSVECEARALNRQPCVAAAGRDSRSHLQRRGAGAASPL